MHSMSGAMRPAAAKAALRPAQMRARSASLVLVEKEIAPFARAICSTRPSMGGDIDRDAVEFDDQHRGRIARIARRAIGFDRVHRKAVHDLHRGRIRPEAMIEETH